ncbi:MAG TPA: hypothetical protein PKA10_03145 [Selenomonadales bacterium]|nr:hypothetical protein [Selenomonadales bacterium]
MSCRWEPPEIDRQEFTFIYGKGYQYVCFPLSICLPRQISCRPYSTATCRPAAKKNSGFCLPRPCRPV